MRGPGRGTSSKKRSNQVRQGAEPSTFAWIEPLADVAPITVKRNSGEQSNAATANTDKHRTSDKPQKAIIVGRGPGLATKLIKATPSPGPVMAGSMALLIALVGVALISPSSDRATANRTTAAQIDGTDLEASGLTVDPNRSTADDKADGQRRDPFAAAGYEAPSPPSATKSQDKPASSDSKQEAGDEAKDAKTRGSAPVASASSLFSADLIAYSSFTPWAKISRRAGGWIDFDGKPTIKVIAVNKNSLELYVVTDVEVLSKKSRKIKYDDPLRQVKVASGGIARFADYRDIQADDVTYTIRFKGSRKVKQKPKK